MKWFFRFFFLSSLCFKNIRWRDQLSTLANNVHLLHFTCFNHMNSLLPLNIEHIEHTKWKCLVVIVHTKLCSGMHQCATLSVAVNSAVDLCFHRCSGSCRSLLFVLFFILLSLFISLSQLNAVSQFKWYEMGACVCVRAAYTSTHIYAN